VKLTGRRQLLAVTSKPDLPATPAASVSLHREAVSRQRHFRKHADNDTRRRAYAPGDLVFFRQQEVQKEIAGAVYLLIEWKFVAKPNLKP
jgi:hypothetical protein